MTGKALVIGAKGGFGLAVAEVMKREGWQVCGLLRGGAAQPLPYDRLITADAADRRAVTAAAEGFDVLIHAVNPPYHRWGEEAMPALEATIAAAKASGATILFPGNIYNFGPDAGQSLTETSPQNPLTRKGKIRKRMEQALEQAGKEGVRVIVLRMADFFGPTQKKSWFEAVLLNDKPGIPRTIGYPDDPSIAHSWAYLPDAAEAAVKLLDASLPKGFHVFHFAGHYCEPGSRIADTLNDALGGAPRRIKRMPWPLLRLVALFVPFVRELFEMRYLWQVPHRLNGSKLASIIGELHQTPLAEAVATTIAPRLKR